MILEEHLETTVKVHDQQCTGELIFCFVQENFW